jgi:hypothetical protein
MAVKPARGDPGAARPRMRRVDQRPEAVMARHRLGVALFLIAALTSFLLSIVLWFTDNREEGVFVGLWVPSILAAGAFWLTAVRRA